MNCSHRPTCYRDMLLGGTYNAYCNWAWARKSSGDFVLVLDDLCAEYQATWQHGETIDVVRPRYEEDLEWLGMKPDRVHTSSHNRAKHLEITARLGIREALMVDGNRLWMAGSTNPYDPCNFDNVPADGTVEGWIDHETTSWNPWYMACCVADDIEFGITGYAAGKDQEWYAAWCLDAYERLGHPAPTIKYHRVLKRQAAHAKISKSIGHEPTIRALRRRGYEPQAILATLRELTTRSRIAGSEEIIIPHGVLTLDEVVCLRERDYHTEELAAGKFPEGDRDGYREMGMTEDEIDRLHSNIMAEARRRLETREHGCGLAGTRSGG